MAFFSGLKPMACAIGFPAIGVGGTGGKGIFSSVCFVNVLSFYKRRQGEVKITGMNAN